MSNDRALKITAAVLMLALTAFGVFVYFNSKEDWVQANNPSTYEYSNGDTNFLVTKIKDMGYTGSQVQFFLGNNAQPYILDVRYGPIELEDISLDRSIRQKLIDDKTLFITIDPKENLTGKTTMAALEIAKVMGNELFFRLPVNSSMTSEYKEYPVKTCKDATREETVLWLKLGTENKIVSEGNCITITGKTEDDLIRGADRFVLYMLGIMK